MCSICEHPKRAEIEDAILTMTSDAPPSERKTIEAIAEAYQVSLEDLKMHALFHTPLVSDADLTTEVVGTSTSTSAASTPKRESLTRKLGLREVDMLTAVSNEYLVTLKTVGRRIKALAQPDINAEDTELRMAKLLTKPMVDLYLGTGGEIRQTVKTMAELDRMLNGPEDNLGTGLAALANAISRSDELG